MTLAQIKTFIIGVLKGWFTNKDVLDAFDEDENGNLIYDGKAIAGTDTYTDEQVAQAVTDVLAELNAETEVAAE